MLLTLLLMTSRLLSICHSYPGGVPDLACDSMYPSGHNAKESTDTPPYFIVVPSSTYRPGVTVKLSVFGKRGHYFRGIYVQARRVGCHVNETEVVGAFTAIDPLLETHHCFGQVHTAVSHTSNVKKTGVSFYWTAPVVPSGHVGIRATVVMDKSVFWTDIQSAPLIDLQNDDTPFCVPHTHVGSYQFDHEETDHEARKSHLETHGNGAVGNSPTHMSRFILFLVLLHLSHCILNVHMDKMMSRYPYLIMWSIISIYFLGKV